MVTGRASLGGDLVIWGVLLRILLLDRVLLGLLFLLGSHVVPNSTAARGTKHAMARHMTSDTASRGAG